MTGFDLQILKKYLIFKCKCKLFYLNEENSMNLSENNAMNLQFTTEILRESDINDLSQKCENENKILSEMRHVWSQKKDLFYEK